MNDIDGMDLQELYNILVRTKSESKEDTEIYRLVRFGIDLHFDINHIFEGHTNMKPKAEWIFIGGRSYSLANYWTEMENRRTLCANYVNELNPELYEARGIEDEN